MIGTEKERDQIIGNLLDRWEMTPNDLKAEMRDHGCGKQLDALSSHVEGVAKVIPANIERAAQVMRQNFANFCDCDPFPGVETFADAMEAAGFIKLVPVTNEALDEDFAAERGIEPGGMMWVLTAAGRAARNTIGGDHG